MPTMLRTPRHGPLWRDLPIALAPAALAAGGVVPPATPAPDPPRVLSSWHTTTAAMPLAVIGAVAVEVDGWIHLLGGLDRRFEATAAIQTRSPREGWRPIGDRLATPRAEASGVRLADGRIVVLGGFSGSLSSPAWHDDGEVLDPTIAGSSVELPPFGESLEGHSSTLLPDGSVLVVAGRTARRLDPNAPPDTAWGPPRALPESRRGHAAVPIGDRRVLIACGADPAADDVPPWRILELPDDPALPVKVLDEVPTTESLLSPSLRDVAAAGDPETSSILLVGGVDPSTRRTVRETWWIEPQSGATVPGMPLPIERGAARVHLVPTEDGIAMLGGEWRTPEARGPADLAMLVSGDAASDQRRALAPLPVSSTRRMRVLGRDVQLLGGYRFRGPAEAAAMDLPAGVHFDTRRYRLSLAPLGRGD